MTIPKVHSTIVLTTSNNYTDVLECYKIGIAGYVVKPLKYEDYLNRIQKMLEYWSVNELISISMYGVNKSIEDLVKVNFGDDKWEAVNTKWC
jgi:DNA-binding NarL/FixJ family response regulator